MDEGEPPWSSRHADPAALERAPHGHVLLVDETVSLEPTAAALRDRGHIVHRVSTTDDALSAIEVDDFDVVLTDLRSQGEAGLGSCGRIVGKRPTLPVVVLTADMTPAAAVSAMRAGAFDYLTTPIDPLLLVLSTERAIRQRRLSAEVQRLRNDVAVARGFEGILGTSLPIRQMLDVVARIADTRVSVLVTGESGTGKELVARAIHARSPRSKHPFVALNCAALPHELLESELFGHARGAFTDAKVARRGLFLEADQGTLFLDEIGEMPARTQVKLLRALQERTVRPVGTTKEVPFDARLVAATNRDLRRDVADGRFREDLYYRVAVVTVHVPPLRERLADLRLLAEAFLQRFARQQSRELRTISPAALRHLLVQPWPGNVRELENTMERAVSLSRGAALDVEDLLTGGEGTGAGVPGSARAIGSSDVVPRVEDEELVTAEVHAARYVEHVLARVGNDKSRAATVLGYNRRTLHRKLRRAQAERRWPPSSTEPAAEPGPRRLLVVAAADAYREALVGELAQAGHVVLGVGTLREALEHVDADLVLTELVLPDGTGDDVARRLRPLPVIALATGVPDGAPFVSCVARDAPTDDVLKAVLFVVKTDSDLMREGSKPGAKNTVDCCAPGSACGPKAAR